MAKDKAPSSLVERLQKELEETRQKVKYWELLATTDDLTGLHNRRMLHNVPHHISERRTNTHKDDVTLLFIDLDDFGQLNKKYGDDVGDEALRLLGKMIRHNIRETDIAIRKGGDEFILFLMGTTPELAASSVVQRLQLMLDGELSLNIDGAEIPIRGSIGVFSYDTELSPLDNLKNADQLMRDTKKERKQKKILAAPPITPQPESSIQSSACHGQV